MAELISQEADSCASYCRVSCPSLWATFGASVLSIQAWGRLLYASGVEIVVDSMVGLILPPAESLLHSRMEIVRDEAAVRPGKDRYTSGANPVLLVLCLNHSELVATSCLPHSLLVCNIESVRGRSGERNSPTTPPDADQKTSQMSPISLYYNIIAGLKCVCDILITVFS